MTIKITNLPKFMAQVNKIVSQQCIKVLNNFEAQAKGSLVGQIHSFRGSKSGSIADEDSIVYTIRTKDKVLTINPNPMTLEVFRRNATEQEGGILINSEAPDWFEYHNIKSEFVGVRPTGVRGDSSRPALGSDERKFFENTYNYLISNAQIIVNGNWN